MVLEVHTEGQEASFSVSDKAAGHPPEEHVSIFEKFYRLDMGDVKETYGYGLGLYLSRRLVEVMGGRIWVESEPGHGGHLSHRPAAGCSTRMSELVLVIDDDATMLGLLAEHLGRASYRHYCSQRHHGAADILQPPS